MNKIFTKKSESVRWAMALLVTGAIFIGGYAWRGVLASSTNNKLGSARVMPVVKAGYANVNGLNMYYEVHGASSKNGLPPLVLLHGALMNMHNAFDSIMPELTKTRQVITFDEQGHGRTADIDRPITHEQMADDTAELLRQLRVKKADFFGWSLGGAVASQVLVRHPDMVRKLATSGANFKNFESALDPAVYKQVTHDLTSNFAPKQFKDPYDKIAPHPEQWPQVVAKLNTENERYQGIPDETLRTLQAPVMIMVGDHDVIRPEHAVETYRLLPHGELAIMPGTDHFGPTSRIAWVASMLQSFFAEPMP